MAMLLLLKAPLLWFCDQQDSMNNPAAMQTNSKYAHPVIMKCYFDWTGLTMPCVFDPDITFGWPKRVPVLRGLGETNALQMASHGPFLAWIWAPLPFLLLLHHHHTSVIGSSCVNKVSDTTSSNCKETRDIKIAMFPSNTLLKNDDTGPSGGVHPLEMTSEPNQGAPWGSTKQKLNLCACIICLCQSAPDQDEPRRKNKPEPKIIYSPLTCKVSVHKTRLAY